MQTVSETGGATAGGELGRVVEITEGVKRVLAIAAHISRVGVNAIIMARRAGDLARGFGVLSTELRTFTVSVTELMERLRETSFRLVRDVSALLQQSRNRQLLERTRDGLVRCNGPAVMDAVLAAQSAGVTERMARLQGVRRELSAILETARQLGQFGTVLARTARLLGETQLFEPEVNISRPQPQGSALGARAAAVGAALLPFQAMLDVEQARA